MPSEALWFDICPCCNGTGQIETKPRTKFGVKLGQDIFQSATTCEACNGKGQVLVCKKIRKGK